MNFGHRIHKSNEQRPIISGRGAYASRAVDQRPVRWITARTVRKTIIVSRNRLLLRA